MPRARRPRPRGVVERLEVDHVLPEVREHPLVERPHRQSCCCISLAMCTPELRLQQRRQPRGGPAEHPRGEGGVVHVAQVDAHLGEQPRVEADVVDDTSRARRVPAARRRRASGTASVSTTATRPPHASWTMQNARAVREHAARLEVDGEARRPRRRAAVMSASSSVA